MLDLELFESEILLHRVFCDGLPAIAPAAYLFGQTPDNEESVFGKAEELIQDHRVERILIPGTGPMSGYPGMAVWQARLGQRISPRQIEPVPTPPTDMLNTLNEAEAVVRHAKAQGYESLLVVAAPFHQQRALMTTVSVVLKEHPTLRVYSAPGHPLDWQETVVHSQGTVQATRLDLIAGELERIEKYGRKGDLLGRSQVLQYLQERDRPSRSIPHLG